MSNTFVAPLVLSLSRLCTLTDFVVVDCWRLPTLRLRGCHHRLSRDFPIWRLTADRYGYCTGHTGPRPHDLTKSFSKLAISAASDCLTARSIGRDNPGNFCFEKQTINGEDL